MSQLRLLLDEHVPLILQAQLEQMLPDVLVYAIGSYEAPPKGTSDPEILSWIETHNCLLLTNNRATI